MGDVSVAKKNQVLWVTLDRPDARNAIRSQTMDELVDAFTRARSDNDVRVIVLTGSGTAFSAGGDVKEMATIIQSGDRDVYQARGYVDRFHALVSAIYDTNKPVLCGVNGKAYGAGCNLALACDLCLMSDQASFCWGFVQRGLVSDAGSAFLLQRVVGYAKAFQLLTLAETVDAKESLRLGLVSKILPHDQLNAALEEVAARIVAGPPQAISMIKRALRAAAVSSFQGVLDNEANLQAIAFGGKEFVEGVMAFIEKRSPKF